MDESDDMWSSRAAVCPLPVVAGEASLVTLSLKVVLLSCPSTCLSFASNGPDRASDCSSVFVALPIDKISVTPWLGFSVEFGNVDVGTVLSVWKLDEFSGLTKGIASLLRSSSKIIILSCENDSSALLERRISLPIMTCIELTSSEKSKTSKSIDTDGTCGMRFSGRGGACCIVASGRYT